MEQEINNRISLNIAISDILSAKAENERFIKASENKINEYKSAKDQINEQYNPIVSSDSIPYGIRQKHNLEQIFLLERCNKEAMPYENTLKKRNLYAKRLDTIMEYIKIKNSPVKSVSQTKTFEYKINSIIVAEAITYYDAAIEEIRQERIVSSKFKFYVDHLQKTNDPDYEKRIGIMPSADKFEEYEDKIGKLQEEKMILIDILRNEKFTMENTKLSDLLDTNIKNVLYLMYPSFREALNNKKGKQVA